MSDGFSNSVVGGGGILVRDVIKSENYVPGVSGWMIAKDGSYELGSGGSIRGDVLVTGSQSDYVKIDGHSSVYGGPAISFMPPASVNPGVTYVPGEAYANGMTPNDVTSLVLQSPRIATPVARDASFIELDSETNTGGPSDIVLNADRLSLIAKTAPIRLDGPINWGSIAGNTPSFSVEAKDGAVTTGTTISTNFVNNLTTSGILGATFVAPPSGKVTVWGTTGGFNGAAGQFCLVSFEVRQGAVVGSGSVFQASDEFTAAQASASAAGVPGQTLTVIGLVSGLTAGASYNVCLTYRVTANMGSFNRRRIVVTPAL